jgi:hypothetical protein
MNSLEWSDNMDFLNDTIEEYCSEENIIFDNSKKKIFNNIILSYKDSVYNTQQLEDMNRSVLTDFFSTLQDNNVTQINNITQQNSNHDYNTKPNKNIPENIYSREDIQKERNSDLQDKFNNVREDFANFILKRPEEIDFSDKVDDDNTSIDQRIEQELLKRQYDVTKYDNNIDYDNKSQHKHVTFEGKDNDNTKSIKPLKIEEFDNNITMDMNTDIIKDKVQQKDNHKGISFLNRLKQISTSDNVDKYENDNLSFSTKNDIQEIKNDIKKINQQLSDIKLISQLNKNILNIIDFIKDIKENTIFKKYSLYKDNDKEKDKLLNAFLEQFGENKNFQTQDLSEYSVSPSEETVI